MATKDGKIHYRKSPTGTETWCGVRRNLPWQDGYVENTSPRKAEVTCQTCLKRADAWLAAYRERRAKEEKTKMSITTDELRQNIVERAYEPKVPFSEGTTPEEKRECRRRYQVAVSEGVRRFRHDLEECFGTGSWPSAERMYSTAWADGHSYGFHEVFSHYMDMVEVVRPTMNRLNQVAAAASDYLKGFVLKGKLEQALEGLV